MSVIDTAQESLRGLARTFKNNSDRPDLYRLAAFELHAKWVDLGAELRLLQLMVGAFEARQADIKQPANAEDLYAQNLIECAAAWTANGGSILHDFCRDHNTAFLIASSLAFDRYDSRLSLLVLLKLTTLMPVVE
ncbi:hypothetical protein [Streptomyces sp. H34-S4]|uniref:hypothetical protein n=1 Tax=Streptomyces sp. H34-S4 TaxID=2996463 RepID=UPI00226DCCDD|nr:hypothetical protein [Streptomyces sp. H34-S4]MCY0939249.1 hypothetical protein [Streptomyces sp. H34-S4]